MPGNHEMEFYNGPQGFASYLTRYTLPENRVPGFGGRWYSFRVGSALFVSLDADDVVYQDAAAFVAGPAALVPAAGTGHPAIEPGTSFYIRGYSGGAQTAWLERTLAAGRRDETVDWIIVQMHQCACSSSSTGNGSDLGIRQEWLPLFDRYQVDLVLNGHDHDYERSFPVRGVDTEAGHEVATGAVVNTLRPHPVTTTDSGVFDTSQGTVHLILGCGGTDAPLDEYGIDTADGQHAGQGVHPGRPARPVLHAGRLHARGGGRGGGRHLVGQARHRDRLRDRGLRRRPGLRIDGQPSIKVTHYHAVGADPVNPATGAKGAPTPDYTEFETFTLVRPASGSSALTAPSHGIRSAHGRSRNRRRGRRPHHGDQPG